MIGAGGKSANLKVYTEAQRKISAKTLKNKLAPTCSLRFITRGDAGELLGVGVAVWEYWMLTVSNVRNGGKSFGRILAFGMFGVIQRAK